MIKTSSIKYAALSLLLFASCDKSTDIDNPEGPQGNGTMEVLSPEQSKEFIEETAGEFFLNFNPEDQKSFIDLAVFYAAAYSSYKLPDNFTTLLGNISDIPGAYLLHLLEATKGDLSSLTRAASGFSFAGAFDLLTGIYQPDPSSQSWIKTADTDDIEFQFKDIDGRPVVLRVSQKGLGSGNMNLSADLSYNGSSLADTSLIYSFDSKEHNLSADISARLMNLQAISRMEGNDDIVESQSEFMINNKKMASSYASVKGDGLCNPARWKELTNTEAILLDNLIGKMIKKAYCGSDVLGKIQLYGQADYYEKLPLDISGDFAGWATSDKETVKSACQQACDRLNKHIKSQLRYNGTKTDQATLLFQPAYSDWETMWGYSAAPMIRFADGSLYTPEEYFSSFADMAPKLGALIDAYKRVIADAMAQLKGE